MAYSLPSFSRPRGPLYQTALQAVKAGISVIPIRRDGSKQPALTEWREYQKRLPNERELERWFRDSELGIACVTGSVSGNLEALDFDDQRIFTAWLQCVQKDASLSALYEHLSWGYLEATPAGGRHLLYRCNTVGRNQKLAGLPTDQGRKTLIETRGEGGLLIIAPLRGAVHPSGKSYLLQRGGISTIRTATAHQRSLLFAAARSFDVSPPSRSSLPAMKPPSARNQIDGPRPGDLFNQLASWEEILLPYGWRLVQIRNGEGYWQRPGKKSFGISATTNHGGHDLLYVFSTSTVFLPEYGYSKFHAYALLNHHEDFSAAARELAQKGYCAYSTTLVLKPGVSRA